MNNKMQKSNHMKTKLILAVLVIVSSLGINTTYAQDVPAEVKAIVGMKMDDAQGKLEGLGYEICSVSPMKRTEDWINESAKICVTIKFDKKTKAITEVTLNPNTSECQKKLENERKMWENYHDGQALVSDAKIDEERKKLADAGFKASYWVNDVAPGRSAEYWVNESAKKVKSIVWETQGNKWVMTHDSDYSMGKNPAPKK
jgi:hypothetical protein